MAILLHMAGVRTEFEEGRVMDTDVTQRDNPVAGHRWPEEGPS